MVKVTYSYSKIFLFVVILIVAFIYFVGLYYDYFLSYLDDSNYSTLPSYNVPSYISSSHDVSIGSKCDWKSTDPVIYNYRIDKLSSLLTSSYDIDYDIDDYFIQLYSIVKERNLLSDHSTIIYNIDRDNYVSHMSGNTRLLMHLSSKLPHSFSKELYFSHVFDQNWHKTLRSGDTTFINPTIFKELQLVDFTSHSASSVLNRYHQAQSLSYWPHHSHHDAYHDSIVRSNSTATQSTANVVDSIHHLRHNHESFIDSPLHNSNKICVKYMGLIEGDLPSITRGHWFPHEGDISSFRQSMSDACPPDEALLQKTAKRRRFKLVVYQRDLSRRIAREEEAVAMMRAALDPQDWDIEVLMHSSSRSPCMLMHMLYNADVLVTAHGFQSMLFLFLPLPALLFEIFPYKYYSRDNALLASEYGVFYRGIMSPPTAITHRLPLQLISTITCLKIFMCRSFAIDQTVILTAHGLHQLLGFINEHKDILTQQKQQQQQHLNGSQGVNNDIITQIEMTSRSFIY